MAIHPWTITETGAVNNLKPPIFILNSFKLFHEVERTAEVKSLLNRHATVHKLLLPRQTRSFTLCIKPQAGHSSQSQTGAISESHLDKRTTKLLEVQL